MRKLFAELPAWVRWGALPVLALLVFGAMIMSVLQFLIGVLFKVLLLVVLAALVVFVVKKFTARI